MTKRAAPREAIALHRRIRADIERRILSGAWPPGHRIPFEHEIMQQYGCARMTANKAIAALAQDGLIVRRRRVGSFVAEPRTHAVVLEIPDLEACIRDRGQRYQLQLIARRRRQPQRSRPSEITLAAGGELLELQCLHRADGRAFALEERLISLAAVPEALAVDFAREAPGTWLLAHVAWTQAEHRIFAINASREVARRLELEERDACLVLERKTWRARAHITHVKQVFPSTQFDLVARFDHARVLNSTADT
jgi:GntR family histidine utilization transcriptional repressor